MIGAVLLAAAFPLAEGTRWTYRGTTRGDYHDAKVVRRVQTTMRVVSHSVVGRYEVAVIDGEPSTIGCDKVPEPRKLFTAIIRDGARYYEVATPNPSPPRRSSRRRSQAAKRSAANRPTTRRRWQSVHHGSPCEIDLRLVSFRS